MKIAVVAANGKVSQLVIEEALKRGHEVVAFSRSQNRSKAENFVQKDILAMTKEDLTGFDAVVDGFGASTPETLPLHTRTSQHSVDLLSGSKTRLIIVGGAGSLYMTAEHDVQLWQTPDFPEVFRPIAEAQDDELAELRKRHDVNWTFISPAADFQADAPATGSYLLGGEEFFLNDQGESVISYADYVRALVDILESDDHIQERISLVRK